MTKENQELNNKIGLNFLIRSASSFAFDLKEASDQIGDFPTTELIQIVANCDNVVGKVKVFKEELEKRAGKLAR